MNQLLFQDLHKFINTYIPKGKIYKDEFFFYLIGDYPNTPSDPIDYSVFSDDDMQKYLSGRKKLRSALGHEYPKMLERNKNLRLQDLFWKFSSSSPEEARQIPNNILARLNEIQDIYKKHEIPMPATQDAETLLLHLFTACVIENEQLFASYKKRLSKPATLESILGREEDARRLKNDIDTYHKVIISDQYGSGKSLFVKYCLSQWKTQDYCYLSYENNLESTLKSIKYHDDINACYEDATNRLMAETSSSPLLVIDNMYYSQNFSMELEELSNYTIDIIVITAANVTDEHFHPFTMSMLSDETLKGIFEHRSGLTLGDATIFEKMLCLTHRNPLMVSLLANQCRKSAQPSQEAKHQHDIVNRILSSLETLNNHMDSSIKYKHPYDDKNLDFIGHVKCIYKSISNHMENSLQDTMKYLCCFGWSPLPLEFIREVFSTDKNEDLGKLSDMGLLSLTDDSVQITPLITHAVFAAENPSVRDYDMIVEKLIQFLQGYDQTLSIPYLSNALFVFAKTLYKEVPFSNNREFQKKAARSFENWQELLYLTANYYRNCGEIHLANQLTNEIQYPEKVKNAHNSLDQLFFLLMDSMGQLDKDETILKIDELRQKLLDNPDILSNADFSWLTYTMDQAIYFYCMAFFNINLPRKLYISIIIIILDLIDRKRHNTKVSIPEEKLSYYALCANLMYAYSPPKLGFVNLKVSISQVEKWKNADYRIRGMAFLLFTQSQYLYFISIYKRFLYLNDLDLVSMLNTHLKPMISNLNEQIHRCELIPHFTLHLCFHAYINALRLQYAILNNGSPAEQPIPLEIQNDTIKELLRRCTLSKKEKDEIIRIWDKSILPLF